MVFFLCFFCPFPWSASKGVRSLTRAWNILGPSASFLLFLTCVSAWAHWTRKVGNEQGFSTKTEQSFVNTWCQSLSLLSPGKCKTFILFHNDLMRSEFQINSMSFAFGNANHGFSQSCSVGRPMVSRLTAQSSNFRRGNYFQGRVFSQAYQTMKAS